MAVPGVRGSSDLPTALASGRGLRSQREERLLTSPLLKGRPSLLLRYHRVRSSHSHRVMASNARSRRREALVVRRKGNSSARAIGTGHTFRPRSSARGLAGMKTAVSVTPCQCRHGYGPYANAHRVCHGSREAAILASPRHWVWSSNAEAGFWGNEWRFCEVCLMFGEGVLLFLDTGCVRAGLKE